VTGRQGRRHRNLLDYLKERRGYSHLKEDALDHTIWRACFGRGFEPVVRQTTKMNEPSVVSKTGRNCRNYVATNFLVYLVTETEIYLLSRICNSEHQTSI
jgi:hypothetical protein